MWVVGNRACGSLIGYVIGLADDAFHLLLLTGPQSAKNHFLFIFILVPLAPRVGRDFSAFYFWHFCRQNHRPSGAQKVSGQDKNPVRPISSSHLSATYTRSISTDCVIAASNGVVKCTWLCANRNYRHRLYCSLKTY